MKKRSWIALLVLASCRSTASEPTPVAAVAAKPPGETPTIDAAPPKLSPDTISETDCTIPPRPWRHKSKGRVVAIGDVHGDLDATLRALGLAGAIDESGHWSGGELTLVQTGDILDRGDDEQEILDLFERLAAEASAAGGQVLRVHGNHELMNALGDFRYVTKGGFEDFFEAEPPTPLTAKARQEALFPGGTYAKRLARHDLALMVDDTIFVHGGVLPDYVPKMPDLNRQARCFLDGQSQPPKAVVDPNGPLWSRHFSTGSVDCKLLASALEAAGAKRMVVGHTPQLSGITSACGGAVWRIDTGMASHYGGPAEVLEIRGANVSPLK